MGDLVRFLVLRLALPLCFVGAGWYGGAKYGAPEGLVGTVDRTLSQGHSIVTPLVTDSALRGREVFVSLFDQKSGYAAGTMEQMLEGAALEAGPEAEHAYETEPAAPIEPGRSIRLCRMQVSNAPRNGVPPAVIGSAGETISLDGVELLLMPVTAGCLSSGFGPRGMGRHRGVDYFSSQGGEVLAAGGGRIVEALARQDYGNMIVIDHGNGVFTRYAHLERFAEGILAGVTVARGDRLGPIGQTGATRVDHLHFEVLTGDYNTPAGSFGLAAHNPFAP